MQRYFSDSKKEDVLILKENDIYHIKTVMRIKNNDKIEVVFNNELFICEFDGKNGKIIEKIITENITSNVILGIPLLVESKMDLILQKSTELGVKEILPINMERSKIKLDKTKESKKIERWTKICKEAAEQSKRLDIPKIHNIIDFKELKNIEGNRIFCCTNEKDITIKKFLTKTKKYDKISIVIGPEGGFSPKEEKFLFDNGFIPVSLGNLIMRVETVPLYLLSVMNYENME